MKSDFLPPAVPEQEGLGMSLEPYHLPGYVLASALC